MRTLEDAYRNIFSREPLGMKKWEIIRDLLFNLNPISLGEGFCQWIIWYAVCHIEYPNHKIRREVVGDAENKATELFPEYSKRSNPEPHMAELEWIGIKKGFSTLGFE